MNFPKSLCRSPHHIGPTVSAYKAACKMKQLKQGAILVKDTNCLVGIISERDLMNKVLADKLDPDLTRVNEIMSSPVISMTEPKSIEAVLRLMNKRKIRHMPILDKSGEVVSLVAMRELLAYRLNELDQENESLTLFLTADGPGG